MIRLQQLFSYLCQRRGISLAYRSYLYLITVAQYISHSKVEYKAFYHYSTYQLSTEKSRTTLTFYIEKSNLNERTRMNTLEVAY